MTTPASGWDLEVDVVVVGSGGAGLTAAILAHDTGARVVVLERDTSFKTPWFDPLGGRFPPSSR